MRMAYGLHVLGAKGSPQSCVRSDGELVGNGQGGVAIPPRISNEIRPQGERGSAVPPRLFQRLSPAQLGRTRKPLHTSQRAPPAPSQPLGRPSDRAGGDPDHDLLPIGSRSDHVGRREAVEHGVDRVEAQRRQRQGGAQHPLVHEGDEDAKLCKVYDGKPWGRGGAGT